MPSSLTAKPSKKGDLASQVRLVFLVSVGVTVLLYAIPYGQKIAYPLMLLSTLVHELGHGVAAMLSGGEFVEFKMWSDGSGVAYNSAAPNALRQAFISAGGLVGPAIAAAVSFAMARRPKSARIWLGAVGFFLLWAEIFKVRNMYGLVFVGVLAAILLVIAIRARSDIAQLVLVFLATQLALSVYARSDYLFTESAETSGGTMPSDVAHMASALGGPYWLWGAVCVVISVAALGIGAWMMLRGRVQSDSSLRPQKI